MTGISLVVYLLMRVLDVIFLTKDEVVGQGLTLYCPYLLKVTPTLMGFSIFPRQIGVSCFRMEKLYRIDKDYGERNPLENIDERPPVCASVSQHKTWSSLPKTVGRSLLTRSTFPRSRCLTCSICYSS